MFQNVSELALCFLSCTYNLREQVLLENWYFWYFDEMANENDVTCEIFILPFTNNIDLLNLERTSFYKHKKNDSKQQRRVVLYFLDNKNITLNFVYFLSAGSNVICQWVAARCEETWIISPFPRFLSKSWIHIFIYKNYLFLPNSWISTIHYTCLCFQLQLFKTVDHIHYHLIQ